MRIVITRAIIFGLLAVSARAQDKTQDKRVITIERPWARATAPSATTGALYFTIVDHGAPDRLIAVSTPVAGAAELHDMSMQGDVMRMRAIDGGLTITSAAPVTLKPGGYHVMLMALKQTLHPGDDIPVTLTFEHAGEMRITVVVGTLGARGPAGGGPAGGGSGGGGTMPGMDMKMPMAH